MNSKFIILVYMVLFIATLGYCAEDETSEGIDLHTVVRVAKDEKYKTEVTINIAEASGAAMKMRLVMVSTVTEAEKETPTAYSVQPIEMESDFMGQSQTEDLTDESPMVITKTDTGWDCTADSRSEGAAPHCIVICQSPVLADCLFPAKPVKEGDSWEINKEQTVKYIEMLLLDEVEELNLHSDEWKTNCTLSKLTKDAATIDLDVTAQGIEITDYQAGTLDIAGKITLTIDIKNKMVSALNGKIEVSAKSDNGMEQQMTIDGEATITKE